MTTDLHTSIKNQDLARQDLSCLYEITKNLAAGTDLQESLNSVVRVLADMKKMENGTVTIVNPLTRELEIEVACGITATAQKKGKYKLGEGITGRVVSTGEPVIVPRISEEPLFLNRTGIRNDEQKKKSSFICVPIKVTFESSEQKVFIQDIHDRSDNLSIGALSVAVYYENEFGSQSEQDLRFLTIVSALIAQTVHRVQVINREKEALQMENQRLRRELSGKNRLSDIIGNSSRMQEVFEMVHRVADSNATVLLRGESGTGKSMVAKSLHHNSRRADKPFLVVNCSALPENLLESELFGHEKGAFTGAEQRKKGRFELAEGGTLFLDEIGEISTTVQIKLLNVIQERCFQRLGGTELIKSDIRLVAATNRNLEEAVLEGVFREDLYYRLNVFPVHLPPLRERRTDILLLAEYFLEQYCQENNKRIERISTTAIDLLIKYHWPGNVRELQNCMERAVLICDSNTISAVHLPPTLQSSDSVSTDSPLSLSGAVESFERELIIDALKHTNGNQTKAAARLETSLRIINYKIHNYGIDPKQFKVKS
ncbi:MAG: sigma 54-interacting transcriptional regulator [Candidatus Electrothrix aestuarii]|uniref:Sigma 54-interacting transcriptional regulator n=1 Tax=Candidatus Electrothrix aestuarii TaxID=3062594 RepID=A0AAU8M076_9BACT|nr:sigma 54-interacting transcriptional regulator [Candidatus Electrothrix aestuarii]WPD23570.1 MAG: sigma 54-interacting transcriptional regulator [Candidatus Electrothrix sp. GW3-3]